MCNAVWMRAGIIGARGSGKSTVFRALIGLAAAEGQGDPKNRARPGQLRISDPRLDLLEAVYGSKKKVPIEVTVLDFAPNPKEQKVGAAFDLSLLPLVRDLDAFLMVIPSFAPVAVELTAALAALEAELVFADLEQVERRLARLRKERAGRDFERAALEKCVRQLESGLPLRKLELGAQELQTLSSFCFLSGKPALVVVNCEAEQAGLDLSAEERAAVASHGLEALKLAAAFEAELWELGPREQRELLAEAGLKAPARERLIAALYAHLGLLTFYTAAQPEAHAWLSPRGATALEAAARIHSDIGRGFIRAEVMGFEDFAALRSEVKVKEAGKLRLEGKDYVMRDGDIIYVRFKI